MTTHSKLTIDIPSSEHRRIRMAASMMDLSIKDFVLMSVENFMHKKPNKVTEKALKQSRSGKNIKKFNTLDELFDDLGI